MSVLIKPVDADDLARLRELDLARTAIADKNLSLDLEKISTLAAGKRVEEEYSNCIGRIRRDRGIAPDAMIEVNPRTGEVVVTPPGGDVPAESEAAAAGP